MTTKYEIGNVVLVQGLEKNNWEPFEALIVGILPGGAVRKTMYTITTRPKEIVLDKHEKTIKEESIIELRGYVDVNEIKTKHHSPKANSKVAFSL